MHKHHNDNRYAVIAVFAEVSSYTASVVSGFWDTLNPSKVPYAKNSIRVSHFQLSSVLPTNLDYYHYYGSLTTPPCTETVQFYLIKQRIQVPAYYLTLLRHVKDDAGNDLNFNYRNVQALNGRIVNTPKALPKYY